MKSLLNETKFNEMLDYNKEITKSKPQRSYSNSCLDTKKNINNSNNENNIILQTEIETTNYGKRFNDSNSGKKCKTKNSFLENTFSTKIAKKLTLENQKKMKEKKKNIEEKTNFHYKKNQINRFQKELNAEWIENLITEFKDKEKNDEDVKKLDSKRNTNRINNKLSPEHLPSGTIFLQF